MRILLGIPSAGAPTEPFTTSLAAIRFPTDVTAFDQFVVTGNFVPAQRELIVERALEKSADILLMCDDDMVLPPDAFTALIAVLQTHPRCGLAGALYYSRDGFRPMAVSAWNPADTTTALVPAFDDSPVEVDGVGFGCVAVRLDAVRELQPLYFESHVFLEPRAGRVRVCNEDYLFCRRLRERGWSVMLDPRVRAGHYDRTTRVTFPREWEKPENTRVARMAAMLDGVPRLLPAGEARTLGEHQRRAELTYLSPND